MSATAPAKDPQFEKLVEQIEVVKTEISEALKDQSEELKSFRETQPKTAQRFEDAEKRSEDISGNLEKLMGRLDELEKAFNRPPDVERADIAKTVGDMLVSSDQFKQYKSAGVRDMNALQLKSFLPFMTKELGEVSTAATSAGDGVDPTRVPGFFAQPLQARRLRNIIPTLSTGQGSVEFVKESNFHQLMVYIDGDSAAAQKVVNVANVAGFYVGQSVTLDPGGGDEETHVLAAVSAPANATQGDYTGTITTTVNLTNTHNAAENHQVVSATYIFTRETELKPSAEIQLDLVTEPMKTLAHAIAASRQVLDDVTGLRSHVDSRMLESLILSEERQILYGAGGTAELSGIMVDPDNQDYAWSSGALTPVPDTKLDAIRRAMTLSMLAHYPVDGVVVHPSDWEDMQLAKATTGEYIWATVPSGTGETVWRAPVIVTTAINAADALVGAFRLGAAIWDANRAAIRMSESHDNFFLRNMVAILAEERLAQTIYRPESFVNVDFDAEPS